MKHRFHSKLAMGVGLLVGAVAPLILTGCASATSGADASASRREANALLRPLEVEMVSKGLAKGISAENLVEIFGKPDKIEKSPASDASAEIWTYRRRVQVGVREVPIGTRDVPYIDPITNEMRMIKETVPALERTYLTEELDILMILDAAHEWRVKSHTDRTID